jgi:beta-1,4-N-acetylglucosaminyltransferase
MSTKKNKKLCLVCSSGGHFLELYSLEILWQQHSHFWVTFKDRDTCHFLKGENVYWAFFPTTRNLKNFFKNFCLAFRTLPKEKPDFVISTGAGVGVPFSIIGKILGSKIIYIESFARIDTLSLSGKLIYFFADNFLVQWPQLAEKYKKAIYRGQLA